MAALGTARPSRASLRCGSAARRPDASPRRSQVVATAANIGGLGTGALVSGILAQWVGSPLTLPYEVFLVLLVAALVLVLATPETRPKADPLPRYRAQRVSV